MTYPVFPISLYSMSHQYCCMKNHISAMSELWACSISWMWDKKAGLATIKQRHKHKAQSDSQIDSYKPVSFNESV